MEKRIKFIENLKLKKYFDTEIKDGEVTDFSFRLKLDRFLELYNNLNFKGNVIPSFNQYFSSQLATLMAILMAINGKRIQIEGDEEEVNNG